ncbi:MAG: sel1 repeat family protein [Oscillospiraceae bacterium]|nr:sel1 repeat family protein [Oscillospiraceae bacterium]
MSTLTILGIVFLVLAALALAIGILMLIGGRRRSEIIESKPAEEAAKWELDPSSIRPEPKPISEFETFVPEDEFAPFTEAVKTADDWYAQGCGELRGGDEVAAASSFLRAAELGHARAQTIYAIQSLRGKGVAQDYESGRRWLEKAARQGNVDAIYNLGICYMYGRGVEEDLVSARKLLVYARGRGIEEAGRLIDQIDSGVRSDPIF